MTRFLVVVFTLTTHILAGILPTIQGYDERTGKPIWGTTEPESHYSGKSDKMRSDEGQVLAPQNGFNEREYQNYQGSGLEVLVATIKDAVLDKTYGSGRISVSPQTFIIRLGEIKEVSLYPMDRGVNSDIPIKVLVAYTTENGRVSPTLIIEPNADRPVFIPISVDTIQTASSRAFNSNSGNSKNFSGVIIIKGGK